MVHAIAGPRCSFECSTGSAADAIRILTTGREDCRILSTPAGAREVYSGRRPASQPTVQPTTLALWLFLLFADRDGGAPSFRFSKAPVPEQVAARMREHSWRNGCPTAIADLVYVRLTYLGFDGAAHQGELVVHKSVADDVVAIFQVLFKRRFPIEKMKLIDDYRGSDDASMADNNTSAFNCRFVADRPGVFSKHSEGRAIDINPRTNPMVSGKSVFPPNGAKFVRPGARAPGILRAGSPIVGEFVRRGWTWGGGWKTVKDYQHFEK